MDISVLVAVAKNGVIGKDNRLLWKLSDDLKLFKKRTLGHVVIMGRKTFDSIGRPLPGRINLVISRNPGLQLEGATIASSMEEALRLARTLTGKEEIFIIGGQQIYELAAPYATRLYLTRVNTAPEGDAFFDLSPYNNWETVDSVHFDPSEKNEYDFEIVTLKRPA
ncbi:dihydrofolate reductase [Leadbetterella sp. DM7]|uniref:dihydrofolate reductase n=1 Tax=Leadbetterella sp. DM7 TaxID=3235085 RepID=UPI00349ECD9D